MTVVNPKSISGINSITTGSGSDNLLTIHTSDASSTERVRINSSGDVIVGSGITVSPDGDIFATGVTTSTTFVGNLTGNVTGNTSGTAGGLTGSPNVTVGDITVGESIVHDGDADTSVKFPAADVVTINTGGGENTRFTTTFNAFKAPDGGNRYYFGGTGNSADAELSLYNASDSQKVRLAANATSFFSGGGVGLGKNTSGATTDGAFFSSTTNNIVLPSGSYLVFNRNASGAGTLIDFRSQNTSKGGIHFNGTNIAYQSGSNNILNQSGLTFDNGSNYLDDYEEGTFTPTLTNGGSLTNSGSYYTKIGRFINFYCYITALTIPNNNSTFIVSGLPFAVASGTYGGPCSVSYAGAANDSRIASIAPNVQADNTYIYFHTVGIGQGYTMSNAHFQPMVNGNLNIQGCYITAT